ncbi:hypothetical protein AB0D94_26075 [Streptomyces sp. NPDC048255]
MGLARDAIESLARTYDEIDDPDGIIGDVADWPQLMAMLDQHGL